MNFITIIHELAFKTMAYNILFENAPIDESALKFLQDNCLISD